jgi:glycine dehydrogenase subunit 1
MASKVKKKKKIVISKSVHPEYRQVLRTYSNGYGLEIVEVEMNDGVTDTEDLEKKIDEDVAATCVQSPNFFGCIEDQKRIVEISHNRDSLAISCVVEPISLGLLKPPGEFGTDIVVGEGQALGNPVSFGGPHLGFITTRSEFLKKIPGRIAGLTVDRKGDEGFILTLQTREQHVRRERATSNICTNQAACALNATIYLALLGKKGLSQIAEICAQRAHYVQNKIIEIQGFEPLFSAPFFNEFSIRCPKPPKEINSELLKNNIIGGFELGRFYPELKDCMMMAVTENHGRAALDAIVNDLSEVAQ